MGIHPSNRTKIKAIGLDTAADQIRQMCIDTQFADRRPYFFIVGAGISFPPVPLASVIVEDCKRIARKYDRVVESEAVNPIDIYSHWFETAFPQPIQRQQYLHGLIAGQVMSHANLRLANLLLDSRISNLVVTTNFDDFLSRALTLFGQQHIVWDHPKTVERVDPDSYATQIIHVHGSYKFYDCRNLRSEIEGIAGEPTMAYLLNLILSRRLPLVIGYSGWEDDVIMQALRLRLMALGLPYNIYWFCHRQAEIELLPGWLKYHPQVSFVVPAQEEGRLTATHVFDKLIQTFQLSPPLLTTDPLGFFAHQLRTSVSENNRETDIYFINAVIERLERMKRLEMISWQPDGEPDEGGDELKDKNGSENSEQ